MKKVILLITLSSSSLIVNSQNVEVHFHKNIELLGYIIELGDPSENDPNHPISIEINQYPDDKNIPALKDIFRRGESLDYATVVELMYSVPEFPQKAARLHLRAQDRSG